MTELDAEQKEWSTAVAELVVDALRDHDLISESARRDAVEVVMDEIWARLLVHDYPPIEE